MRHRVRVALLLVTAVAATPWALARAQVGDRAPVARPEVWVGVPAAAPTPGVIFPFGGAHGPVPGAVTIDRAPYYCEAHAHAFRDRAGFLAHLRRQHHLTDDEAAKALVVERGQVRYVGR